jgi:GH25 family lysozyme M1 (1,4-beta-N-acetylmuramidase)
MARVQGIDVSHWQGNMNWTTAYNAGNRFTWAKATQASATLDDQFANNLNNAKPAGMLIGFYHFANPSRHRRRQRRRLERRRGLGSKLVLEHRARRHGDRATSVRCWTWKTAAV